jgi:hypothetical protein
MNVFIACVKHEDVAQLPSSTQMTPCPGPATSSRFERRLPVGRHNLAFKVAFGGDGKAARAFNVSRMTVWRWRHDRAPLPGHVIKALTDLIQSKVIEAHEAQTQFGYFLLEPPKPPRPLSGCCAGRYRRPKRMPRTPEEWAALG